MRRLGGPTSLMVIAVLFLQVAWIITVPPFRGSDEFDHAYRAAGVAGGQWRADQVPEDGRGLLVEAPRSLVEAANAQCEALKYTGPDNCNPAGDVPGTSGETVLVASGAANYHPAFYWVVGTAASSFEGPSSLYAMRIVSAALCLVFLLLAAWAVTRTPGRWPLAAVFLAMSPVFLYSTAITAPNGMEMSAALALWAALLALADESRPEVQRRLMVVAIAAAVVVSTLRMLGPLFVLMIAATVLIYDSRAILKTLWAHRALAVVGSVLVTAAAAGSAAWVLTTGSTEAPSGPLAGETAAGGDDDSGIRLMTVVVWLLQMIAAFPLRNEAGAPIVYPIVALLVAALVVAGLLRGQRREQAAIAVAVGGTVALPIFLSLVTRDGYGLIWQGRYGLPYSVGLVVLAGWTLHRHLSATRPPWPLAAIGVGALGVGIAACLIRIRGTELGNPPSAGDSSWLAPTSPVLIALVALAMALVFASVSPRRMQGDRPAARDAERTPRDLRFIHGQHDL